MQARAADQRLLVDLDRSVLVRSVHGHSSGIVMRGVAHHHRGILLGGVSSSVLVFSLQTKLVKVPVPNSEE